MHEWVTFKPCITTDAAGRDAGGRVVDTSYQDTGQDWSTDSFTPAEREALMAWYSSVHGLGTMEFCQFVPYMLGLREDALKRYRH
jgi:hypothetical protein